MAAVKPNYQTPKAGQPLITTISTGCTTPILKIKYSNLVRAFYYPNSTIPRYSITCFIDPERDKDFIKGIQTIEKNEKVESVIKNDTKKENGITVTSGLVTIKFQGKDIIPVYFSEDEEPLTLEEELAKGESVIVTYDILRYTKKNTIQIEHGISFKPTKIIYIPTEEVA